MHSFVIIGVGGFGRGVCNHIKYEIEQKHGSLISARTFLLVIDGPQTDPNYQVPREFEIDTRPNSNEWYQTAISPGNKIQEIAQGAQDKRISKWLSQSEAKKIPSTAINPTTGFGGQRIPGHVYFYLDCDNIAGRIGKVLTDARTSLGSSFGVVTDSNNNVQSASQVITFIVGSSSGGTGAGLLFDVATITQYLIVKGNAAGAQRPFGQLILLFPLAKTFHNLQGITNVKIPELDAKNHASLLNLQRLMTHKKNTDFPFYMDYSDNYREVSLSEVIQVPFVFDGDNLKSRTSDVKPQHGAVPAVAEFVESLIHDNQTRTDHFAIKYVNWDLAEVGGAKDASEMFASFGAMSYRYPYKEVLDTFKYRFACRIIDLLLSEREENYNAFSQGDSKAENIIKANRLTAPFSNSDSVHTFCYQINPEITDSGIQQPSIRLIPAIAQLKVLFDASLGNSFVSRLSINPVRWEKGLFGGIKEVPDQNVITTWKNYEGQILAQIQSDVQRAMQASKDEFTKSIFAELKENILNPDKKLAYPETGRIMEATCLLEGMERRLKYALEMLTKTYNRYYFGNEDGPKAGILNLIERQEKAVGELERAMLLSPGNVYLEQMRYCYACHIRLQYKVWSQTILTWIETLRNIREIVNRFIEVIGKSVNGWVNVLTKWREIWQRELDREVDDRRERAKWKLRKYFPHPDEPEENILWYKEGEPRVKETLSKLSWQIAGESLANLNVLLNTPADWSGFDSKDYDRFFDVVSKQYIQVKSFNPASFVWAGKNALEGPLSNLTIYDLMELDYLGMNQASPIAKEQYASTLVNSLIDWSEVQISSAVPLSSADGVAVYLPTPPQDGERVGNYFYKDLQERLKSTVGSQLLVRDVNPYKYEIRAVRVGFRLKITDWSYYGTERDNYKRYIENPVNTLVDIYPQEQNARKLIWWINKFDLNYKEIDPQILLLLDDLDLFITATFALLEEKIPQVEVQVGAERSRNFRIEIRGTPFLDVPIWSIWKYYVQCLRPLKPIFTTTPTSYESNSPLRNELRQKYALQYSDKNSFLAILQKYERNAPYIIGEKLKPWRQAIEDRVVDDRKELPSHFIKIMRGITSAYLQEVGFRMGWI